MPRPLARRERDGDHPSRRAHRSSRPRRSRHSDRPTAHGLPPAAGGRSPWPMRMLLGPPSPAEPDRGCRSSLIFAEARRRSRAPIGTPTASATVMEKSKSGPSAGRAVWVVGVRRAASPASSRLLCQQPDAASHRTFPLCRSSASTASVIGWRADRRSHCRCSHRAAPTPRIDGWERTRYRRLQAPTVVCRARWCHAAGSPVV